MVRIAILDLTNLPEKIGGGEKVGELIVNWLQPAMPDDALTVIRVAAGAPVPDVADFDGFVLSGSELGVYDTPPWLDALRALILKLKDAAVPMFGICYGHQIMADTLGGKAELVDQGENIGSRQYDINGQIADANVWHQDQVTKVPQTARIIGGAVYCPVGVLAYDFPAMSVQFHPEYTNEFLDGALKASSGTLLEPKLAQKARETLVNSSVPVDLMAAQAASILGGAVFPSD